MKKERTATVRGVSLLAMLRHFVAPDLPPVWTYPCAD